MGIFRELPRCPWAKYLTTKCLESLLRDAYSLWHLSLNDCKFILHVKIVIFPSLVWIMSSSCPRCWTTHHNICTKKVSELFSAFPLLNLLSFSVCSMLLAVKPQGKKKKITTVKDWTVCVTSHHLIIERGRKCEYLIDLDLQNEKVTIWKACDLVPSRTFSMKPWTLNWKASEGWVLWLWLCVWKQL